MDLSLANGGGDSPRLATAPDGAALFLLLLPLPSFPSP
jgi:hypothetical protein